MPFQEDLGGALVWKAKEKGSAGGALRIAGARLRARETRSTAALIATSACFLPTPALRQPQSTSEPPGHGAGHALVACGCPASICTFGSCA